MLYYFYECRLANCVLLPVWLRASRTVVLQLATCIEPFLIVTYAARNETFNCTYYYHVMYGIMIIEYILHN